MKKCLFIYNPHSGKGKIVKNEQFIKSKLQEKFELSVIPSQYAGHMGKIISERGNEFDVIVVSGGDGTINEAVNSIARLEKRIPLGYIPTGTVNDVAHSLHIPCNIKRAVDNIINGVPFSHDILQVNDKFGIYVCCSGLFTTSSYDTSQEKKKKMGKLAYFLDGAKKVFSTRSVRLKLSTEKIEVHGKYSIFLVINSRQVGGMKINRKANLNDGLADVILVESEKDKVNLKAILRTAFMFIRGIKRKSTKKIQHMLLDKFKIETDEQTIINLDGEKIGSGSFDCKVIKERIDIIIPKKYYSKLKKE